MEARKLAWPRVDDDGIDYPDSDGKPLGETGFHVDAILALKEILGRLYRRRRVFVAADMFFYYEQGNPQANKAPDVMVIKGVSGRQRRSFKLWLEGKPPNVIFEMISKESRRDDLKVKPVLYAQLGVAEYFIFDPLGDILKPPLRGFRLVDGQYEAMTPEPDGGLTSLELGLRFVPEGGYLRVIDRRTGKAFPFSWELRQLQEEAQRQMEQQKLRADALEAELERLRAQIKKQKS